MCNRPRCLSAPILPRLCGPVSNRKQPLSLPIPLTIFLLPLLKSKRLPLEHPFRSLFQLHPCHFASLFVYTGCTLETVVTILGFDSDYSRAKSKGLLVC